MAARTDAKPMTNKQKRAGTLKGHTQFDAEVKRYTAINANVAAYTHEQHVADVIAGRAVAPDTGRATAFARRSCPFVGSAYRKCEHGPHDTPDYYLVMVHRKRVFPDRTEHVDTRPICYDAWLAVWWDSTASYREIYSDRDERTAERKQIESMVAEASREVYRRRLADLERLVGSREPDMPAPQWSGEIVQTLESVQRLLLSYEIARDKAIRKAIRAEHCKTKQPPSLIGGPPIDIRARASG